MKDPDVERKEAGARTFRAPIDAGLQAAEYNDAPNRVISKATPASTSLWVGPASAADNLSSSKLHASPGPVQGPAFGGPLRSAGHLHSISSPGGEEAGVLHQRLVTLFLDLDPLGVVGARSGRSC